MTEQDSRRWDNDERRRGVGDARANLPSIEELAELARTPDWIAEDPRVHLLPGLQSQIDGTGLRIAAVAVAPDGALSLRLAGAGTRTRRELRQAVWSILGGAVELSTHVRESQSEASITFDVVTGNPSGGHFATHGHTLRIVIEQP
jgi:hypothetical protein